MKTLVLALALALASSAYAAGGPDKPLTLPAKRQKPVIFSHGSHAPLACTTCHKDDKGGPIAGFNATVDKKKAHDLCMDCHAKQGKGPKRCSDCHKV